MKHKKRDRIKKLLILLIILILMLLTIILNKIILSGNVVLITSIPADCSNESIKALWNSIFIETSTNIQIYANTTHTGRCDNITAYKLNGNTIYMMIGAYSQSELSLYNSMSVAKMNLTQEAADKIRTLSLPSGISTLIDINMYKNSTTRNLNLSQTDSEIRSIFKVEPTTWQDITNLWGLTDTFYSFNYTEISTKNRSVFSAVSGNHSYSFITITEVEVPPCIPNIIEHNTSCNSSETKLSWYTDSNNCGSNIPENKTPSCNYNNDTILGNSDEFKSRINPLVGEDITIFINNTSNLSSQNFTNLSEKVEFKGAEKTYLEFYWDFSNYLDINKISLERQSSGNKGYLIVKGVNVNKTIYVDRLNSSSKVCAENSEISSISSISSNCNKQDEILLNCPDSSNSITCEISSNNTFKIQGLTHSGATEFWYNDTECIPNWTCSSWQDCINGIQIRNCTDKNYCFSLANKPPTNQTCTSLPGNQSNCTANWNI